MKTRFQALLDRMFGFRREPRNTKVRRSSKSTRLGLEQLEDRQLLNSHFPDAYEPDNTAAEARSIATDASAQMHSIHVGNDVDWVRFSLSRTSDVTIETNGPTGDTRMWLYGPNSPTSPIAFDDDSGNGYFSRIVRSGTRALGLGTYYVKVDEYGNNNTIASYTLSVRATPAGAGDAYENDDTPANAKTFAVNGSPQTHSIHVGNDVDWVTFSLTQTSDVTIETNGASGDTRMWLYGPNSPTSQIAFDDDSGNGYFSRIVRSGTRALGPGIYYVKVDEYGNNNTIVSYTLSVNATVAPSDPDDQISEATPLGSMAQTRRASGAISLATDVDMYSIAVTAGQRIIFDLDRPRGGTFDSYLRVIRGDGSELRRNDDGPNPTERSSHESYLDYTFSTGGTYYVGISGYGNGVYDPINGGGDRNGSTGDYTLTVSPGFAGTATRNGGSSPVDILRVGTNPGPINPSLTTWVVIHGLNNNRVGFVPGCGEAHQNIQNLAVAIQATRSTDQVLTLDWSQAARGTEFCNWNPYDPEQWIIPVAEWASQTLIAHGFVGSRLNLVGHSFGSYIAAEIARRMDGHVVNSIVSLDPAADVWGGYSPNAVVNFETLSNFSWAFHSSHALGSEITPLTADEAILVSGSGHGEIVPLFTHMIRNENQQVSRRFSLTLLINGTRGPWDPDEYNDLGLRLGFPRQFEAVLTAQNGGTLPDSLRYVVLGSNPAREVEERVV